jgi:[ribosomal protein S18]-alanine N-acetyltransferase
MAAELERRPIRGAQRGTIRKFRIGDLEAVMAITKESPEAAEWDAASYRELEKIPGMLALVSESEGKVRGFVIARQAADEGEILNLAVTPAKRGKGEGGALLEEALRELRRSGVSRVFLEVRESNERGIAFYAKHGFAQTGRRAGYYHNPDDAAIVMVRKLTD